MSKENVILSSCFHENFNSTVSKRNKVNSCKNCGIMSTGLKYFSKPEEYDYECEFDQKQFLEKIKHSLAEKLVVNKEEMNMNYINLRPKIVSYLRKLCESYDYSEETFNAALFYADKILVNSSNLELKYDLTVIGCLLLAVKFIERDPSVPCYSEFRNSKRDYYSKEEISNSEKLCLRLLDFKLNVMTSFDILKYFLVNGLITSSDSYALSNFYTLSVKILNYFILDIRSLDFSPAEVAIASVVRASEFSHYFHIGVKSTLLQVYEIKAMNYMNASFVIRNIHPELIKSVCEDYKSNDVEGERIHIDEQTARSNPLKKQKLSQKTVSYKDLQSVNLSDFYKFYQFGNFQTIPTVNMGANLTNLPNIKLASIPYQPFNNSSFTQKKSYFNVQNLNILKEKSPDHSHLSTKGNSRMNSNRNSEDSFIVDFDCDNSPKVEIDFKEYKTTNLLNNYNYQSTLSKFSGKNNLSISKNIMSNSFNIRKKQSDESFTRGL